MDNNTNKKSSNSNYLSAREARAIAKKNRKITAEFEKRHKRKNMPESEYLTRMRNPNNVVEFDNLHTYFFTDVGTVKAVSGVSFDVPKGKTVGIVGESGCGKSVTSLSMMQLVQRPQGRWLTVKSGSVPVKRSITSSIHHKVRCTVCAAIRYP